MDAEPARPKKRTGVSKATTRAKKATPPLKKTAQAASKGASRTPADIVEAPGDVEHVASAPPLATASSADRVDVPPVTAGVVPSVPAGPEVGAGDTEPAGATSGTEPTEPAGATGDTEPLEPALAIRDATPETTPPATTRARKATGSRTSPTKKAAPARKATRAKKAAARDTDAAAQTGGRPAPPETEPGPGAGTDRGATSIAAQPDRAATTEQITAAQPDRAATTKEGTAAQPDLAVATNQDTAPDRPQPERIPPADHATRTDAVPEPAQDTTAALVRPDGADREPESGRTAGAGWRTVAARILDHPGFAPELLAIAAVEELGPRARDWAERTRGRYPGADADGLARLAARRFVRLARTGGALAAGTGLFAPAAELAAVLWTQANLVLHLAAVYGRDPADPERVAELLVLTQVHPDVGTARAALDAVRSASVPVDGPWPRAAEAAWRLATPLAAQAGGWLGLRLASRLLPGAAVLTAAAGDAAAAERLAARATARYRPVRAR
ncbi:MULTISPECIES: hypothetical protein [Micromonospora]|uniref:hypothetical protein n=1 Tax=Micromonospora TaxID=1873 RepID=UPI001EF93871|nr:MULTISPECIES: hypothetical protein [Micromonospora]